MQKQRVAGRRFKRTVAVLATAVSTLLLVFAGAHLRSAPLQATFAQAIGRKNAASTDQRIYLAMCLAIKDLHEDVREWVGHHLNVGAEAIFVYDTGSTPPLNETLADYIQSGSVVYTWHEPDFGTVGSERKWPQMVIYKECIERGRKQNITWMGFMDSDEFLIPRGGAASVPEVLAQMSDYAGGLAVPWVVMGSSGHIEKPKTGVLKAYTKCGPQREGQSTHIKSIVRLNAVAEVISPHQFAYLDGRYAVLEEGVRQDGPRVTGYAAKNLILYHYTVKSREEYTRKSERGTAMGNHKPLKFFEAMDRMATADCLDGLRWAAALEQSEPQQVTARSDA